MQEPPLKPSSRAGNVKSSMLELRANLWPDITDAYLWPRNSPKGFAIMPRTMPLILDIIDDLTKGKPASTTYLELWCRLYDESVVKLDKSKEMAFLAGHSGQRGERTWRDRIRALHELGFINVKSGKSGELSYALIFNPYLVIRRLKESGHPGIRTDKYNALMDRAAEIGATDFSLPDPWAPPAAPDQSSAPQGPA